MQLALQLSALHSYEDWRVQATHAPPNCPVANVRAKEAPELIYSKTNNKKPDYLVDNVNVQFDRGSDGLDTKIYVEALDLSGLCTWNPADIEWLGC